MSKFTVGMKLKTREGLDARILATDLDAPRSMVVAVKFNGREITLCYFPEGRFYGDTQVESSLDLMLPKEELWINKNQYGIYAYNTEQRAVAARCQCEPDTLYSYVAKRFVEAD